MTYTVSSGTLNSSIPYHTYTNISVTRILTRDLFVVADLVVQILVFSHMLLLAETAFRSSSRSSKPKWHGLLRVGYVVVNLAHVVGFRVETLVESCNVLLPNLNAPLRARQNRQHFATTSMKIRMIGLRRRQKGSMTHAVV